MLEINLITPHLKLDTWQWPGRNEKKKNKKVKKKNINKETKKGNLLKNRTQGTPKKQTIKRNQKHPDPSPQSCER